MLQCLSSTLLPLVSLLIFFTLVVCCGRGPQLRSQALAICRRLVFLAQCTAPPWLPLHTSTMPWYYQCTPTPWVPPGQTAGYEILAKSSTFLVLTMRRFRPPHIGIPSSNMFCSYPRLQHGLLSFLVNVHNGSVHRLSAVVQASTTKGPLQQKLRFLIESSM